MIRRALAALTVLTLILAPAALAEPLKGPLYEVFVREFFDSDGDGAGDLRGVREKLDYVRGLGANSIWLMPVMPSPSYHGYDVTDYMAVNPNYGALSDFESLAEACHDRGMKVILDLPLNHTSSAHPWFLAAAAGEAPYDGYYSVQGSGAYVCGFGEHMPELNLDNPDVRAEILEILAFWLAHGADGFRLDAVTYYYEQNTARNLEFLTWLNGAARGIDPDAYLVGEAWTDDQTILSLQASGLDGLFGFPFAGPDGAFAKALRAGEGAGLAEKMAKWSAAVREASPHARMSLFLSNHDMARFAGTLRFDAAKLKLAAALYLLTPGVPVIYYGEELGLSGSGADENKRLPMLWRGEGGWGACLPPENADQAQRQKSGVSEQSADPDSLLNFYRALLAARNQRPEFDFGAMTALDAGSDAVCAFAVGDGERCAHVYLNLSEGGVSVHAEGEMLFSWGEGTALSAGELTLAPLSGVMTTVK